MDKSVFLFILSHLAHRVTKKFNYSITTEFVIFKELCRELDKLSEEDFGKLLKEYTNE